MNKDLQELKEYYLKPVILENDMGTFTLNRYFSWFECNNVDWNGADILIYLEVDENCDETANSAMATLLKYARINKASTKKIVSLPQKNYLIWQMIGLKITKMKTSQIKSQKKCL